MGLFQRHRWFVAAAGITLAFGAVSLTAHKSAGLTAFADLAGLAMMLAAAAITLANAITRPPQERSFWALMTLGFSLWASNQAAWANREILLHQPIPDPYFFDIILFFHLVPMIAATAWRPDLAKREGRVHLSTLNFLMLLGWWIFLYAFMVFPHQYVVLNIDLYNVYYDRLYLLESAFLFAVLALAALTSSGGWKRLYLHFLSAAATYGVGAQFIDRAVTNNTYYSGSLYDVPLIATVAWMAAAAMSARQWDLKTVEPSINPQWKKIIPRLAMLAILSLPILGLWTVLLDNSASPSRTFRIFVVLGAMFLLGGFVFLRQYFQDQALMTLLQNSRRGYESQARLQSQLVQKEKLASLGTLVAGAAHEINHPLNAIMSYSEQLWAQERLTTQQNTLLRKIVNQARRTRDLVNDLLSFAQQAPGEKTLVDLSVLLSRATQMLESRHAAGKIRVAVSLAPDFPRVQGNANQLFQVFVEMIENAMDALEETGGGLLEISGQRLGNEAVLQFADTGPGIREPQRVFDPFYTTKPVGKGTGLGLSAVYGVIQEHSGQITCQNKPEGGALFIVKFPIAAEPAAQVAGAAGD
ncbi:MAG TPA: HAMP domain-containing sensor histidine kinase [Candidatus Sulfotelmatobacter sp.]|jgi:signal transduction histidine kinase|nr:HAMP domain-containing sensor histidine kinase [Candidatus Sulfotelmatobacter sp.]